MKKINLLLIFLTGIVITTLIHLYFTVEAKQKHELELAQNSEMIQKELEYTINNQINAVSDLRAFMLASITLPDFDAFDRFSQNILATHPTITALAYIDPNRIIRHFYPLKGNEKAIGLNLMTRPAAPYVDKAIREDIITVSHPTITVQGKLSMIARAPLLHNNELKGLVQGLLEINTIMNEIEYHIDKRIGYILKDNNGSQFAKKRNPVPPLIESTIKVEDNRWTVGAGWNSEPPGIDPLLIVLIWVLGTLLNLAVTNHFYRTANYTKRLSRDVQNKTIELKEAYQSLEEKVQRRTVDLKEAKDEAIKANSAKTHFLSRMSHELRTPLNAILGFAQLLNTEEKLDSEHKEQVQEILNAGEHLLDLINEVLDLSRIETGNMEIKFEDVILKPALDEILTLTQPIADKREITLYKEYEIDDALAVVSEKTRLKEVLLNLLSNAIKYNTDKGTVTLKCNQLDNNKVRIVVIDSGPGLDPEQQKQVFEPFNRLGAEFKGIEGSGIGLSITSQLLELMDSELILESTPGEGSQFYFDLNLAR